jgi:hypothetical protein
MDWSIFIDFGGASAWCEKQNAEADPCGMSNKETTNGKSKDEIQGSFAALRMTT